MRDEQLTDLFRSLRDASDPDPAFADELFGQLRAEASVRRRRSNGRWIALLAAALLLVAFTVGAALVGGTLKLPSLVVTPQPSASISPVPSSSASASQAPQLPAVLPPSSLVRTVTGVPLQEDHTAASAIVATIPVRELVLVQAFGPVRVDGDDWYQAAWSPGYSDWPAGPRDGFGGWIAVTRGGVPTIEVVAPRCPEGAPSVRALAGMTGSERLSCLGDTEITLHGSWVAGPEGGDGIVPYTLEPAWLQSTGGAIADGGAQVQFTLAPDAEVPTDIFAGDPITLVGHHDDGAARGCSIDLEGPIAEEPAHLFCREIFVATSIRIESAAVVVPAPGSLAATLVDGVRLRAEPGTSGEVLGTLSAQSVSYVVDGPNDADGYRWWLLAGLGLPPDSGCATYPGEPFPFVCPVWYGWAAETSLSGEAWLEGREPAGCPPPGGLLTEDSIREPLTYAACFGTASLTFAGWLPEVPSGIGFEACPDVPDDLQWIACDPLLTRLYATDQESAGGFVMAIQPGSGVDLAPLRGAWVSVTGRFDHPAAAACERLPFGWERAWCRGRFVVESIQPTNVAP